MLPKISIIIPCYNEAKVISQSLQEIKDFFNSKNWDYEVIVIDDGSTDNTVDLVKNFEVKLLINEKNRGKGYSIKKGVQNSSGDLILFMDADMSTPIAEFDKLEAYLSEYDIIIGSRSIFGAQVEKRQSWYKQLFGKLGNLLIRLFLGLNFHDTQCGFKLFKKEVRNIFAAQTLERWGFDFELLFIAKKRGYKIKEVGVRWVNDEDSKVRRSDYIKTFGEVVKVRLNSWRGKYK